MKPCSKCGQRQVRDNDWACRDCKAAIVAQSKAQAGLAAAPGLTVCPSCRAKVSTQANACPQCGHHFRSPNAVSLKDPVHFIGLVLCGLFIVAIVMGLIL